ncbi:MAG: group II intron reverse transcriptase/maturase [Gemmatimonadetes bacterium]|nr:group II intron reverse transcriptase/maturase [Gemmatimonadota bacterium]
MEEVLRHENLMVAYKRVVKNGGAGGVDGRSVDDLKEQFRTDWPRIREQLLSGSYEPSPVRKVEIPKPGGGVRTLGIPTVMDRMIQQALHQALTPLFDPTFSEDSYGFRPGRSTHQAVLRAKEHIEAGHRWVVDLDLEAFFDTVHHDVLMARVARRVKDKRVLRLIGRYLRAEMMEGGLMSPRTEGTPQGGPLSPLLSNILLDELDKELERRGHRFVRYADDFQVYVRSEAAGERVMASLERFLKKRLRLKVNRKKSAVGRPWKRKFLGYRTTMDRKPKLKPDPKSVKRLKTKLKALFRRGRGWSLAHTIRELNPVLRGWGNYYRLADVKGVFEELDKWVRRRLRLLLWRQWKQPRTRFKALQKRGLDRERAKRSAYNGFGPWWNAGTSHMNQAVPTSTFSQMGLVSLLQQHRRLVCSS